MTLRRQILTMLLVVIVIGVGASALVFSLRPTAAVVKFDEPVMTIGPTTTGTFLTDGSLGLSFEASDLTLPEFTSGNLSAYLKTLGSSVIRIGGNTVDQTYWTSSGETPPDWSIATITPDDLTALNRLAKASGWKIILGVNLKHYSPARAADEAAHAATALGSSLQAIEIGNEPDRYPQYTGGHAADYVTDFDAYVSAIHHAAPGARIDGTDAAFPERALQTAFVAAQKRLAKPQIAALTSHYYPLVATTCHGSPTIADLLGETVHDAETTAADTVTAEAASLHVPAVIDEGNNVVCEGQEGVSDVFAAALWTIDEQLDAAREGVAGDYKHGTIVQCGSAKPLFMYYTPLCAPTVATAATGRLTAQPEYYGLLAVHDVGAGAFLRVTNPLDGTVRTYAVRHADGTMTVVLDNLQGATTVELRLDRAYTAADAVSLTASGLTAASGITLGGQTVAIDGTLTAPHRTAIAVHGDSVVVTVPATGAEILTFRG